jgi:3-oxo-5-alpha-steroid 4-dehydrogenase 1
MMTADANYENGEGLRHSLSCDLMVWISLPTFLFLHFVSTAPFGKHAAGKTKQWWMTGIQLNAKVAWCVFESPNLIWAAHVIFAQNRLADKNDLDTTYLSDRRNQVLLFLFVLHYVNRTILHPLQMSPLSAPVPLEIAVSALMYTTWNG